MPASIFEMLDPLDAPAPVEPLRVLMVHNRYREPGGEDVVADAQTRLLTSRGHDVRIGRDHQERGARQRRVGVRADDAAQRLGALPRLDHRRAHALAYR